MYTCKGERGNFVERKSNVTERPILVYTLLITVP